MRLLLSCSITSQNVILNQKFFLSRTTYGYDMDEFVSLSAYAICAKII
jgi:hypothetical protein